MCIVFGTSHYAHNRQFELLRELEVAFVVPGHRHDGAGAVAHQHVVRRPDGNHVAVGRVHGVRAREDARLLLAHLTAHDILLARRLTIRLHRGTLVGRRHLLDCRMLRRQHQVRRAEDRVGARREDGDHGRAARDLLRHHHAGAPGVGERVEHAEAQLGALAPAQPIALRRARAVRPVNPVEVLEQALRVRGDAEEPLLQGALLHHRPAALARAGDHLLVGQHGLA